MGPNDNFGTIWVSVGKFPSSVVSKKELPDMHYWKTVCYPDLIICDKNNMTMFKLGSLSSLKDRKHLYLMMRIIKCCSHYMLCKES